MPNQSPAVRCKVIGCRGWAYGGRVYCRTHRFENAQKVSDWRRKTKGGSVGDVTKAVVGNSESCLDGPAREVAEPRRGDERPEHAAGDSAGHEGE